MPLMLLDDSMIDIVKKKMELFLLFIWEFLFK